MRKRLFAFAIAIGVLSTAVLGEQRAAVDHAEALRALLTPDKPAVSRIVPSACTAHYISCNQTRFETLSSTDCNDGSGLDADIWFFTGQSAYYASAP